ncbi:MAG: hydroxylamine oxidase [bacterium]|nr:MAG: hydroxylamine oxidase [bacterium]
MYRNLLIVCLLGMLPAGSSLAAEPPTAPLSAETEECIGCHISVTPGIVKDWSASRHQRMTPGRALQRPEIERRISVQQVPDKLSRVAVGCYECHSQNPDRHADNFEHMGYRINVVVSPNDCATCHPVEVKQYSGTKKARAHGNLMDNPLYMTLAHSILGSKSVEDGVIVSADASENSLRETCLGCHGTRVEVRGMKTISTPFDDIQVPDLTNWPNQGVGRINPDGSLGACTSCHPRHEFSIEVARKPYTCAQCHLEPDVPAWNVYKESKHGNIYLSKWKEWDFTAVPWVMGEDFRAPTCAVCHNSLVTNPDGDVIARRTHDFGARLWVRLFSLVYSHPQPRDGDVTVIRNADGLPLPTTFTGQPATEYLIDGPVAEKRQAAMVAVCNGCHSTDWINGHFDKLDRTIEETDRMILTTTRLMTEVWERGIEDGTNPFDETIEKMWLKQWLFYGNSIKYASAMTGAPDYAAFKNGWWEMSRNLREMADMMDIKGKLKEEEAE